MRARPGQAVPPFRAGEPHHIDDGALREPPPVIGGEATPDDWPPILGSSANGDDTP